MTSKDKNKIKYLSCFSGIGGFEEGINNSKYGGYFLNVGYSEIDKYAKSVYKKHYPNHTDYGDITKINTNELPEFDFRLKCMFLNEIFKTFFTQSTYHVVSNWCREILVSLKDWYS